MNMTPYTEDRYNDHESYVYHSIYQLTCPYDNCTKMTTFRAKVSLWTAFARMQIFGDDMLCQDDGLYARICPVCWSDVKVITGQLCGRAACRSVVLYFMSAACALWSIKRDYCKNIWCIVADYVTRVAVEMAGRV